MQQAAAMYCKQRDRLSGFIKRMYYQNAAALLKKNKKQKTEQTGDLTFVI